MKEVVICRDRQPDPSSLSRNPFNHFKGNVMEDNRLLTILFGFHYCCLPAVRSDADYLGSLDSFVKPSNCLSLLLSLK